MDIKQLKYFIEIVDCDCNLSVAANHLHISQPALSQMIKQFEKAEDITVFQRFHGKLNQLTPQGQLLYKHAQKIITQYELMHEELQISQNELSGDVNIGIPPFMISTLFSKLMGKLKSEEPKLHLNILETGGEILKRGLLENKVDIAILLKSHDLPKADIEEVVLIDNELCVFIGQQNPLCSKPFLTLEDLNNIPIAMYNKDFMIHHYLVEAFKDQNIQLNTALTSAHWDFLLRSTIDTNIVTILPALTVDYFPEYDLKIVPLKPLIRWQVVMVRNKKNTYATRETYVFDKIKHYFTSKN